MSLHKSYYIASPLQVTDIPKTIPLFLGFYTTVGAGGKQLFFLLRLNQLLSHGKAWSGLGRCEPRSKLTPQTL